MKGDYCWTHWPLAAIGYQTPTAKPAKKAKKHEDLRESFREELERDFQEGRHRSLSLKRQDFPRHVDGIWFETLDDYSMYATGDVAWGEDLSADALFFDSNYTRRSSQKQLPFKGELQELVQYKSKPKPQVKLTIGTWKVCDTIQHMNYVVVRAKDQLYYAVWLSLITGDKDFALCDILKELPVVGVQSRGNYNYHVSKGCLTFSAAEDFFHKGGETFYRMRERIKKSEDPTYFPPNLRAMAVMARWNDIPEQHRAALKEWKRKGCKGWYGKRSFDTNWKDSRII